MSLSNAVYIQNVHIDGAKQRLQAYNHSHTATEFSVQVHGNPWAMQRVQVPCSSSHDLALDIARDGSHRGEYLCHGSTRSDADRCLRSSRMARASASVQHQPEVSERLCRPQTMTHPDSLANAETHSLILLMMQGHGCGHCRNGMGTTSAVHFITLCTEQ